MKTNIQYRISFFRFAMSLACTLFLATIYLQVSDTHAMSVNYREKLCERNFYGANYKPYLQKTCGLLWQKWTFDILNTEK